MSAHSNLLKGSLYSILAFFFIALFGILTKLGLEGGSVIWVSFIIYVVGIVVLIPYILKQGLSYLKSNHYIYLVARAVFGTIASFCYTISILYIPIVNGTLLFNTAPIFIPILMMIFWKKNIQASTWLAVFIGFIGIVVIIKPTADIFTEPGNLIALFAGFSLALAFMFMKLLTATDPGIRIVFWYLTIGMLIQIPILYFIPELPTRESVLYSIVGGLLLVLGQICLVRGYKFAEAPKIGIYQYTSVVFVGFFEWLFWDIVPSGSALVGVLLVALAGIVIIKNG